MDKHVLAIVFFLGAVSGATAGVTPAVSSPLLARLEAEMQSKPNDVDSLHRMALTLMQQARTSSDVRIVARAESTIERALTLAPKHAKSWALKAWSQMSRHQFSEVLVSAREAQKLEVGEPLSLGLLADALVELGQYDEAIEQTQLLVDRHPGLPSYSRAAHLRFLHGDTLGAIELMEQAARAGQAQSEELVWVWLQLGDLYLQANQVNNAERVIQQANQVQPNAHATLAQLGKLRVAQQQYEHAAIAYAAAIKRQPNPEYILANWKLAKQKGDAQGLKRATKLLNAMALLDEKNGGLSRRTFVEFLSFDPNRLIEAESLARKDLELRSDIYGEDTLAWVLHLQGKDAEASAHSLRAMRLGTQDVSLLQHAAAILPASVISMNKDAP